jgi:hypothetical protein
MEYMGSYSIPTIHHVRPTYLTWSYRALLTHWTKLVFGRSGATPSAFTLRNEPEFWSEGRYTATF